jgi:hypothetical protein
MGKQHKPIGKDLEDESIDSLSLRKFSDDEDDDSDMPLDDLGGE